VSRHDPGARVSRRAVIAGATAGAAALLVRRWDLAWAAVPAGANYVISVSGGVYKATRPTGEVVVSSTSLKAVMDGIKAANTWFHFTAGTFDYGTIASTTARMRFTDLSGMTFTGEGIDVTILQNNGGTLAADTEVFDMVRCSGTTIRDMTVRARGSRRESSDAIDFDNSSNCLIRRVKIDVCERGDGIVFDGKDVNATAQSNVIRDCIVVNAQFSGIQFWAVENSRIINCTLEANLGSGVWISKASTSAAQPNKKSRGNRVSGGSMSSNYGWGVRLQSSDDNVIELVQANNNGRGGSGRAGVRITTLDGVSADRNIVRDSTCTDTQAIKTQSYGVHIGPAVPSEANRTQVLRNYLAGNGSSGLLDGGVRTSARDNVLVEAASSSPGPSPGPPATPSPAATPAPTATSTATPPASTPATVSTRVYRRR
jgi:parallel beta-helix repeat protein